VGGVKLGVFLRLLNYYKPNHLDELAHTMDMVRTKSCIVDKLNLGGKTSSRKSFSYIQRAKSTTRRTSELAATSVCPSDERVYNNKSDEEDQEDIEPSSKEEHEQDRVEKLKERAKSNLDELESSSLSSSLRRNKCESSLSESRIKSMVQVLKHSNKFGPNNDLVAFLNSKLNEGYILLKTAFEYIDPDHLGYLLAEEFKIVLTEFSIHMNARVYDSLIKKYDLLKHGKLVDYQKFLKTFQEQRKRDVKEEANKMSANSVSQSSTDSTRLLSQTEKQIFEFFHSSYLNVYNFFRYRHFGKSFSSFKLWEKIDFSTHLHIYRYYFLK
jgi:Ca2+-binding EF-hand superfamily protein